jgi:hypothetical protein
MYAGVTDDNLKRYVLEAIDPATASIAHEVSFETKDTDELCSVLGIPAKGFQAHASYPLDASAISKLKSHHNLQFESEGFEVWLRPHHPNDDLPYKVHTGRELAMMLAGTKPLAAFYENYPRPHDVPVIPEKEFEPYVKSGRFVKREILEKPGPNSPLINGQRIGLRRVIYATPAEQWRIDAYLNLWETAKRTGWTEQLEREEGTLLGYEDWQNDVHMQGHREFMAKDAPASKNREP